MIIVKESDNTVLLAKENFDVTKHAWFNSKLHKIEEVENKPIDFRGRHYTYNNGWEKTQVGIDYQQIKEQEILSDLSEQTRLKEIEREQESSSLRKVTIEQANNFIDANVSDAGTAKVLKRMIPFILK